MKSSIKKSCGLLNGKPISTTPNNKIIKLIRKILLYI